MMRQMKENDENKKQFAVSIICGTVTIIAVVALVLIASFIVLPTAVRVAIIIFAVAVGVVGIGGACILDIESGCFECPECKELFVPTMNEYIKGHHTLTKRKLTCPKCGKASMCKHRIKKQKG